MLSWQEHSSKVMRLFGDIFGWLPLATVVNNKILVTHGGISNITDLSRIDKIDRHKVCTSSLFYLFLINQCERLFQTVSYIFIDEHPQRV